MMIMVIMITEPEMAALPGDGPGPSTRHRLLAAAAEVFAEKGYEGAALADIARRAGFTTGAIYSRFRDKAELLLAVVEQLLAAQQDAAVTAAFAALDPDGDPDGPASAGAADASRSMAGLTAQFVDPAHAPTRTLIFEAHVAARRHPEIAEVLRRFQSERLAGLAEVVRAAQASGDVDPDADADAAAALFMAIPLGLVLLDAAGVELPPTAAWASLAERAAAALRPPTRKATRHGRAR